MHSQTAIFRHIVRGHMRQPPPQIDSRAAIAEAANILAQSRSGLVLIVDSVGRHIGVLTNEDIVRRVLWRATPSQTVETLMTSPIVTASENDTVVHAITIMRRRGISQLPVTNSDGKLVGLISLEDALFALSGPAVRLIDRLALDDNIEGLRAAKHAQGELIAALLDDNVPAPEIQAVLKEINTDLHRRAISRAIAELEATGWGAPPVSFALIVMGSMGRGESFLAPDQDNGFILADYDDAHHTAIDAYFVALAERFTLLLDTVGFPLCKGNVMATNPVWRKRSSEWLRQVSLWMRRQSEAELLSSDILLDFDCIWGEQPLAARLREHLTGAIARHPAFVRALFSIEADHQVALGWFGRLKSERDEQDRPGMINLKVRGTLPLVEAARIMALKAGIAATSTLDRLAALKRVGNLHISDFEALRDAYLHIAGLLLHQQVKDFKAGRDPADFVPEEELSKQEKEELVRSFRSIENLRATIRTGLTSATF